LLGRWAIHKIITPSVPLILRGMTQELIKALLCKRDNAEVRACEVSWSAMEILLSVCDAFCYEIL
jgi:hypothetical protein